MKKKFFLIFLVLLLISNASNIFGQTLENAQNLAKYWHYRYRLTHYFMVVGEGHGMSLPADSRNNNCNINCVGEDHYLDFLCLHWADGPVHLGYYLGVLATEYKLLKDNGQDVNQTLTELYYAMLALERLDEYGDGYPSGHLPLNGYMMRDDVPPSFVTDHPELNFDNSTGGLVNIISPYYTIGSGKPGFVTNVCSSFTRACDEPVASSQDNLYGILMGLALIKKCLPNSSIQFIDNHDPSHPNVSRSMNFYDRARTEADHIVLYIRNSPFNSAALPWHLTNPSGTYVTNIFHKNTYSDGGDASPLSHGLAKAGQFITGTDYNNAGSDDVYLQNIWREIQINHCLRKNTSNISMPLILAAIGDSWTWDPNLSGSNQFGTIGQNNINVPAPLVLPNVPFVSSAYNVFNSTADAINYQGDYDGGTCTPLLPFITPTGVVTVWGTENYDANHVGWNLFYGALHRFLHDYSYWDTPHLDLCQIELNLYSAPWDGPFCHNTGFDFDYNGWANAGRYYFDPNEALHGDGGNLGNYNGLDYMLMHNLYYLLAEGAPDFFGQNCPATTDIQGYWKYYHDEPYLHINPNQLIVFANSTLYTEPASNCAFGFPVPGSAYIIGGPSGVIATDITVLPGAELGVFTIDGCGLVDPSNYLFNSNDYRSMMTSTNQTQPNNAPQTPTSSNGMPLYAMTDEFKNDVKSNSLTCSPNPSKENTLISFLLKDKATITITVTDSYGKETQTLLNNVSYDKGAYSVNFNSSGLAAGIYHCQMIANDDIKMIKLVITK